MCDLPSTSDILALMAAAAALSGACTAYKALNTWKAQLNLQVDQDLALRVLRDLAAYKDTILDIKNPYLQPTDDDIEIHLDTGYPHYLHKLRLQRWQNAKKMGDEARLSVQEANVFWPCGDFLEKFNRVDELAGEILFKLDHLERCERRLAEDLRKGTYSQKGEASSAQDAEYEKRVEQICKLKEYLESPKYSEDQFARDLANASKSLEVELVSKIRGDKRWWFQK